MKKLENIPNKIKYFTDSKKLGLSYSALWYGLLAAAFLWLALVGVGTILVLTLTEGTIYSMADLLKLVTWSIFCLGGLIASYKAGYKGWQHGLWVGLFLGLFSVIFLLEVVPTIISLEQVIFQWVAAAILGTSGGVVGQKILQSRKNRKGYTFKQAKRERVFKLDRS